MGTRPSRNPDHVPGPVVTTLAIEMLSERARKPQVGPGYPACLRRRNRTGPNLSLRELAVTFTDTRGYFISEASVYRLLKAHNRKVVGSNPTPPQPKEPPENIEVFRGLLFLRLNHYFVLGITRNLNFDAQGKRLA